MKSHSKSFYTAFRSLPEEQFHSVAAIYSFCRQADDIADGEAHLSDKKKQLTYLESTLRAIYEEDKGVLNKAANQFPWLSAFAHTVKENNLDIDGFLLQLSGQKDDLSFEEIKDLPDLIDYARKVAGSVGLMLIPILVRPGCLHSDLKQAASDLGVGMQITNILRDIGEDIRDRDRIYLPTSLMNKYQVSAENLKKLAYAEENNLEIPDAIIHLWEELAHTSNQYYQSIFSYIDLLRDEAKLPLVSSALIYKAIGDEVRKNNYNAFNQRNYTSRLKRLQLIKEARSRIKKSSVNH